MAIKNHEVIYAELSFTRIPKFFGVAAYLFCVHSMVSDWLFSVLTVSHDIR